MSPFPSANWLRISVVPPMDLAVEYYEKHECVLLVTNASEHEVILEQIELRFQSDASESDALVTHYCGLRLASGELAQVTVEMSPTALFLTYTNTFDVKARFRALTADGYSGPKDEVHHPAGCYIIIHEPTPSLGDVFISIKQPQDRRLGEIMQRMLKRAGFNPFLMASTNRPLEEMWRETIEPALKKACADVVIWTDSTTYGTGVQREVAICRKSNIPEILLLEVRCPVPDLYEGSPRLYHRFDDQNPGHTFARVVDALRAEVIARGRL